MNNDFLSGVVKSQDAKPPPPPKLYACNNFNVFEHRCRGCRMAPPQRENHEDDKWFTPESPNVCRGLRCFFVEVEFKFK
jgi:hypothetical protein